METIKKYVEKIKNNPELIRYVIIGVCTTAVNFIVFGLFTFRGGFIADPDLMVLVANVIAWTVAVIFAYVTNKTYVFQSHTNNLKASVIEFFNFVLMRVLSLGAEEILLWLFVIKLSFNSLIVKFVAQVLVVILNYVFSKLYIFKGEKK